MQNICYSFPSIQDSISNSHKQNNLINSSPNNSQNIIPALNFKDIDIREILRSIAIEYQTNIVIDNNLNSRVSLALFNVTVFDAIKTIAKDNGLFFDYDSLRLYVKAQPAVTPPLPVVVPPKVIFNNGLLSVECNTVNIGNFIDSLRAVTHKNFLIPQGTNGYISGILKNIAFDIGLKNILQNNGFDFSNSDDIYYVFSKRDLTNLSSNGFMNSTNYQIEIKNNKITLNLENADLSRVIDEISKLANLEIIKLKEPNNKVTIKCSNVIIEDVFRYLFTGCDFDFKKDGNTYIIGEKKSIAMSSNRLIKLNYLRADKVKIPNSLLKDIIIDVSIEHNAFILTGPESEIQMISNYVKTIDKPVPQVLIEAIVVEFRHTDSYQRGLNIGTGDSNYVSQTPDRYFPGLDVTAGGKTVNKILKDIGKVKLFGEDVNVGKLGKLPENFYVNLKALQDNGIVDIKSKPLLSTINGHTASLKIGTTQNYVFKEIMPVNSLQNTSYLESERIQKIEANISFEITPWVGSNDELTLEIKPEFQTPIGEFNPDKNEIPSIDSRAFSSTVRLKDGETIVLGGLIKDEITSSKSGFPFLSDIPILGDLLFSSVSKKKVKMELIIYLTPRISYGEDLENIYINYSPDK